MKNEELKQFIQEWLAAWSSSPEELLNYYHPNATYSDPSLKEPLTDRNQLSNYFSALLRKFNGWKWELVELFDHTPTATLKWKATFLIEGKTIVKYGMDIIEIKDEKIIRNEVYFDRTGL